MEKSVTHKDLDALLKEIARLRDIADNFDKQDEIKRNSLYQTNAEKEYELKYKKIALYDKYKTLFLPEFEKKINDAIEKELNEESETKVVSAERAKIADLESQAKDLEEQAKAIMDLEKTKKKK